MNKFRSAITVMFLQLAALVSLSAQGMLTGAVTSNGGPVPFATVAVKGTTFGTAANASGRYSIVGIPEGDHIVVASSIGYSTQERNITVTRGSALVVDFELQESLHETEGVTVTGTMTETFLRESPVKVTVISPRFLQKIPTANVMEVIENINGVKQQMDCGVCGTNNIRINGMDGAYTAVLIDGMPIMSNLATVYGLNGISPSLIRQVEVIKGPMSTLYGSEAMSGVINVITKSPQAAPTVSLNTFVTTDREFVLDGGVVASRGDLATIISGTLDYNEAYLDDNGDNFADIPLNTRVSLMGKMSGTNSEGHQSFDAMVRYYHEDRLGGTREFIESYDDSLRGSDRLYGETIKTRRIEALGRYYLDPGDDARIDVAFNHHDQDSYYGSSSYSARQTTGFAQLVWPLTLDDRHSLLLGGAARYQSYDDNTGATGEFDANGNEVRNGADARLVPGIFAQHEWHASTAFRLLSGLRADYHESDGVIASPRLSVLLNMSENTAVRLNGGTGFRIVNLFTEDHAAYTGARATVLLEDLEPERSVSGTASLQQIVYIDDDPLTVDLEGFYSYFTNKIEPDYSTPGRIVYSNLDGSATTRGVSLTLTQSFSTFPLSYTIGGTLMDVFIDRDGKRSPLEFAPRYQGVANVSYTMPCDLRLDYTMNLTGPMKLPEYDPPFERPGESPTFSIHNLQVTRSFDLSQTNELEVYAAVMNMFDETQPTPLVDPANPFGENFDTAYAYGPIHGRCIGLGLRLVMQ